MLVLTRKQGERIFIGEEVTVEILGVNCDGTVKVGINAPRDITIDREEVRQRLRGYWRKDGRVG